MSGLVFMPFPLFFSLYVVVENRNGMREPSCGNERALTQAPDLRSTFPGVSHFAVLCSLANVLSWNLLLFLLLDDCICILSTLDPVL